MGGTDDPDNIVLLTPEEHYVAHQLLCKMYPKQSGLWHAACMMTSSSGTGPKRNNKLYGWIRRGISENMKGENNPMRRFPEKNPFARKGKDHPGYGRIVSEHERAAARRAKLGDKNPNYGIKPWNHGQANEISLEMWSRADKYYSWWINSGLEHGQNPMARAFGEKYRCVHTTLVSYFRKGWIPYDDNEWRDFFGKENGAVNE
tara:strand:+ start:162 stop:770 length:609 start_codon:yes stop_codon:yes gene_type:complete